MTDYQPHRCAGCGAPLPLSDRPLILCEYCGSANQLPGNRQDQRAANNKPDLGDLLLGTDFSNPEVPGWYLYKRNNIEFHHEPGYPPEVWYSHSKESSYHPFIEFPGPIQDCDVSFNLRFISGNWDRMRGGIEIRFNDSGDYLVALSPQRTFCVGYHTVREWGDYLCNWSEHPALKEGWGETNRVRVVSKGDQIKVFLNGELATSLRDSRFQFGQLLIVLCPKGGDATLAISGLQLREVN